MNKKLKAKKKQAPKYGLTLLMKEGKTYSSSGKTIQEALNNLGDLTLLEIKTFGTFIIKQGNKRAELMMRPIQIKRLLNRFASSFTKEIFEGRILRLMK